MYLRADAYGGYDGVYATGVTEVACWAHTRRKFFDARETDGRRAAEMLAFARRLYAVEDEAKAAVADLLKQRPDAPADQRREVSAYGGKGVLLNLPAAAAKGTGQAGHAPTLMTGLASRSPDERMDSGRYVFVEGLGGGVLRGQATGLLDERLAACGTDFVRSVIASIKPRDVLEEMLCVQMAWVQARLARLSSQAAGETSVKTLKVLHEAAGTRPAIPSAASCSPCPGTGVPAAAGPASPRSASRTTRPSRWSRMETQKTERRQTNKDCPQPSRPELPSRPYRLSPEGLASLRRSVERVTPWQSSTGPRTAAGKARARANALKHGDRSARRVATRREIAELVRLLRADAAESELCEAAVETWLTRIDAELTRCRDDGSR